MVYSPFDGQAGWLSNSKYKTMALDFTAQVLRDRAVQIRTEATILELATIEASTEWAVEKEHDDRAMTMVIGLAALKWPMLEGGGAYVQRY